MSYKNESNLFYIFLTKRLTWERYWFILCPLWQRERKRRETENGIEQGENKRVVWLGNVLRNFVRFVLKKNNKKA